MREFVNYQVVDGVALVTIDRPPVNALSIDAYDEINQVLDELVENQECRVLVFTGRSNSFSVGADIKMMQGKDLETQKELTKVGPDLSNRIESLDKPSIGAISGYALGGGLELAVAFDFRVAADTAKFGQSEIGIGGMPGAGGTQRVPRLVGKTRAKRLMFTGEMIDAEEAYRIGLVDMVVRADQLISEADKLARAIASKSPLALRMIKKAIDRGLELPLPEALGIERECFLEILPSEDHAEGIKAFLEKRPPVFKGR